MRTTGTFFTVVCGTFLTVVFLPHFINPAKSQGREYSPLGQDDISGPITRAQAAQKDGNCPLFFENLELWRSRYLPAQLTPTLLQQPTTTPEYQTYLRLREEGCSRRTAQVSAAVSSPEFTLGAGLVYLGLPKRSYLGHESMGAPAPTLGLVSPDRNATGSSISGSFKIIFDTPVGMPRPQSFFDLNYQYGPAVTTTYGKVSFYHLSADINQQIGTIDPGAGNRLVIPGPLGGPSGFSLGMYPLNIVRDATYSADFNRTGARIDIGRTTKLQISVDFDFYGSAGYAHSGFEEHFLGSIPGFIRDFVYTSFGRTDQLKLRAGFAVGKQFIVSQAFTAHVGVFAEAGPDISSARGTDSLAFTGFPTSSVGLSASKTDIGFTTGVRLSAKLSNGFQIGAQLSYLRATGLPVFERDGNEPTVLKLEAGDMWTVSVRGTIKF